MIERIENQAEGNSQEVKIKISEKKVRKPNIQIAEVPERENRKQRGEKSHHWNNSRRFLRTKRYKLSERTHQVPSVT